MMFRSRRAIFDNGSGRIIYSTGDAAQDELIVQAAGLDDAAARLDAVASNLRRRAEEAEADAWTHRREAAALRVALARLQGRTEPEGVALEAESGWIATR